MVGILLTYVFFKEKKKNLFKVIVLTRQKELSCTRQDSNPLPLDLEVCDSTSCATATARLLSTNKVFVRLSFDIKYIYPLTAKQRLQQKKCHAIKGASSNPGLSSFPPHLQLLSVFNQVPQSLRDVAIYTYDMKPVKMESKLSSLGQNGFRRHIMDRK